jgi:hypothetical protein
LPAERHSTWISALHHSVNELRSSDSSSADMSSIVLRSLARRAIGDGDARRLVRQQTRHVGGALGRKHGRWQHAPASGDAVVVVAVRSPPAPATSS